MINSFMGMPSKAEAWQKTPTRGPGRAIPRILALLGGAGTLLVVIAVARDGPRRARGEEPMDFVQYYFSSWQLQHGLPVYNPIAIDGRLAQAVGWHHVSGLRTANPPALVCFTWPLALFPYPVAWWTLCLGSLATFATASWIAARRAGWNAGQSAAWAALGAGSIPTMVFVTLNHIEAPILLLGVGGWLCLRNHRPYLGAALWGIATALKLFPAFWLITLLRSKDRRVAGIGFGSAFLVGSLGVAVVGWDAAATFFHETLPQSNAWESDMANMSVRSFGSGLFGAAGGVAFTAVAAILFLWAIFTGNRSIDRMWCLGLCGSLLLSPLSWSYYLVLAVPVAALIVARLDLAKSPTRTMVNLGIATLFFWPSLLGGWMPGATILVPLGWPWVIVRHAPTIALATLAWAAHLHLGCSTRCQNGP